MTYYLSLHYALQPFLDWMDKGKNYYWSKTISEVMQELIDASVRINMNRVIPYQKAHEILQSAETTKMIGTANKGMEWIKQQWKKNKIGSV